MELNPSKPFTSESSGVLDVEMSERIPSVHFVMPLAKADWPFVKALREAIPNASFDYDMPGLTSFGNYRVRLQMWMKIPRLFHNAFVCARNVARRPNTPDFFCVGSDVELAGAALANVLSRRKLSLVLMGYIYTPRPRAWQNKLRIAAFRSLFRRATGVIAYSNYEASKFATMFNLPKTKFLPAIYGCDSPIAKPTELTPSPKPGSLHIVSAGRSWRDYALLCESIKGTAHTLEIICDADLALTGVTPSDQVKVVRKCYGDEYRRRLSQADVVAVILQDIDISSGQMVIIDAMAQGRPVIATQTSTTTEYATHEQNCLFVAPGSIVAIQGALDRLSFDIDLKTHLGEAGRLHQLSTHSFTSFAKNIAMAFTRLAR